MRKVKYILSKWPLYVLWAMLGIILWGWIFTLITDTKRAEKVSIFIDAAGCDCETVAARLSENAPDSVKSVQVHLFSDALFDTGELHTADIYLIKVSKLQEYSESILQPAEYSGRFAAFDTVQSGGQVVGFRIYTADTGTGFADDCVVYTPEGERGEDWTLVFGCNSVHIAENPGACDDAARDIAYYLLTHLSEEE